MKKIIKSIIYNFPIHLKNYIILESNPDLSDNTFALYKMLLKKRVNEKYKIFWFVKDKSKYKDINIKNVYFVDYFNKVSILKRIKIFYIHIKAKYIIDCNKFVYKKNKRQKRLHLGHGMPYKLVPEYCKETGKVDFLISLSPFFDNELSELHIVEKNKIIDIGFPRNDDLFSKDKDITVLFKNKKYKKIILWLPTYRQRKNIKSEWIIYNNFKLGLPIIYSIENLKKLNNLLKELDILLVLKPHPAQDLSTIKAEELSNFVILTDYNLTKKNINLYEFLGQTDALITDYSSVYYDYLLTDKPIAITKDDFEEYKKNFNFVYDNIFDVIKGEYINNFDDFKTFFYNVANGKDLTKEERIKIKNKLHKYQDGESSNRVYKLLENEGGL